MLLQLSETAQERWSVTEFTWLTFNPLAELVQVMHGTGLTELDLGLVAL